MGAPNRILVRTPNWLGDQVMARGFYGGLRDLYPSAEICLLGPRAVLDLPLPSGGNWTRALEPSERHLSLKGILSLRASFQDWRADLLVSLVPSWSALIPLAATGIRDRVGFSQGGTEIFLTAHLPWPGRTAGRHKARVYESLLEFLGGKPSTLTLQNSLIREKLIVLAPGASISLRRWEKFPELIAALRARYPDYRLVLVGNGTERAGWEEVDAENLMGETSLMELVAILKKAALVIANDSGPAHLAASLAGAKTIVLMGPGDPSYILPEGPAIAVRVSELSCSPCESAKCRAPYGYKRCLLDLTVERVMVEVQASGLF